MNRKPTPEDELYRWHRDTLAHIAQHGEADRNRPRISENEPRCGWFMRRLVAKGPYVPCRIWVEPGETDPETGDLISPERWLCTVDGQPRDVAREWTWLCGHPISEDKYFDMLSGAFAQPREARPATAPAPVLADALQTDELPQPAEPEQTGAVKTMF